MGPKNSFFFGLSKLTMSFNEEQTWSLTEMTFLQCVWMAMLPQKQLMPRVFKSRDSSIPYNECELESESITLCPHKEAKGSFPLKLVASKAG